MKPLLPLRARTPLTTLALLSLGVAAAAADAPPSCSATSSATPPTVVELYTSEGCSSCPPADRWLSTLKGRTDVLPLAFHVTYWDRLGWPDRFALAEGTARQHALAQQAGQRQVYTPQVVAAGRDWRIWPQLPPAAGASPVSITLTREGDRVAARTTASAGAPAQLAGYWAVLEDRHESAVRSGENAGETLRHDHVVRLYRPVAAWAVAQTGASAITVNRGVPEHPRRVVFVVTDAATLKPLQAVALGC